MHQVQRVRGVRRVLIQRGPCHRKASSPVSSRRCSGVCSWSMRWRPLWFPGIWCVPVQVRGITRTHWSYTYSYIKYWIR